MLSIMILRIPTLITTLSKQPLKDIMDTTLSIMALRIMKIRIKAHIIMTLTIQTHKGTTMGLSVATFSIMTLSIMVVRITTLIMMTLCVTIKICVCLRNILKSVVRTSVILLNVVAHQNLPIFSNPLHQERTLYSANAITCSPNPPAPSTL